MTVVLVHGAWHGSWTWDRVVPELDGRGVESIAVELPFEDFEGDVAVSRDAIERAGPGAVVCGHSYGGLVISAAARDLPVGHLVFLAALVVDEDEDWLELFLSKPSLLQEAMIPTDDGRLAVDEDLAHEAFYGDADTESAASLIGRLRTVPAGNEIDQAAPAWRSVPSTYVVCTEDRAIHPDVQRLMARHAGTVVEWGCDHSPWLSRPGDVAALLAEAHESAVAPQRG